MFFLIAGMGLFLASCDGAPKQKGVLETRNYQGVFPGANTPILYDLTLYSESGDDTEGMFDLSMEYMGKGEGGESVFYDSEGEWELLSGDAAQGHGEVYRLIYSVDRADTTYFLYLGDSLKLLDRNMNNIESNLNYTLRLMQ